MNIEEEKSPEEFDKNSLDEENIDEPAINEICIDEKAEAHSPKKAAAEAGIPASRAGFDINQAAIDLHNAISKVESDKITISEIAYSMQSRGFGFVMIICCLPLVFPLPYPPGVTTILSIPLFVFSLQMMMGMRYPFVPKFIGRIAVSRKALARIIAKAIPFLNKFRGVARQRYNYGSRFFLQQLSGAIIFICALCIAIPFPLTNLVPSYGIFLLAIGLIARDGLLMVLGALVSVLGVISTFFVVKYGLLAFSLLWGYLKALLLQIF